MQFSANLGFLWAELSLPDAIRAAKTAGFDAVECHWPYETPTKDVVAALTETNLNMLGLNTSRGDVAGGDNGLSAIPGREVEARAAIDQAIAYARAINTPNIHVMAGFASGPQAHATFVDNLTYACTQAAVLGITILIEPLNHFDAPNYFLSTTDQALHVIADVNLPNLKLMFDCYHVQLMEGNLSHKIKTLMPSIGHIQFAAVPGRTAPDGGEINYPYLFKAIADMGYAAPLGAEYKPMGATEPTLGWLNNNR
jgi:hydroxypyruvate isomerase